MRDVYKRQGEGHDADIDGPFHEELFQLSRRGFHQLYVNTGKTFPVQGDDVGRHQCAQQVRDSNYQFPAGHIGQTGKIGVQFPGDIDNTVSCIDKKFSFRGQL